MSESAQHQQLVRQIITYVVDTVGLGNHCFIMSDAADSYSLTPMTEEGFRPDVFYQYENLLIIGEAKTSNDVDRLHSRQQYESYIRKCSFFQGNALFIVSVPWTDHATIHNILRKIRQKYPGNYSIVILDGIGGAI